MPPGGTWRAKPTRFADLNTAARIKRIIETIARTQIEKVYPRPRYATVTTVITSLRKAIVYYPDDPSNTFVLAYGAAQPSVGSRVRVSGRAGARYIDDVLTNVAGGGALPSGGTTGQVLAKSSATDGDATWQSTIIPSGGTADQVLAKASATSYDVEWQTAGGGAATEAQFGWGGTVAPAAEAHGPVYVMAAAHTFTKVIVSLTSASTSTYTINVYKNGTLADTFTVATTIGGQTVHTETVSIVAALGDKIHAAVGTKPLGTGVNMLVVCR